MLIELRIALRYTFTSHKEKFVSIINRFAVIGIMLGVATLIIVMSVMNGYEKTLLNKILNFKGHLVITNYEAKIKNWQQMKEIFTMEEILFAIPVVEMQALAMSDTQTTGVLVKGIEINQMIEKINFSNGNVELKSSCNGIIVGKSLHNSLQNDQIKLIVPKFSDTLVGEIPRMKTYNICGNFDVGMYEYNSSVVFMHLNDAQLLFQMQNIVSGIEITLRDIKDIFVVKNKIKEKLRYNNFDNANLAVIDWQQSNKSLVDVLKVERTVMFIILLLIIVIAVFNIISSLMLLVHDKMKEIAILRTIGMTKKSIIMIFVFSGVIIGFLGTILGAFLGILFSLNIESIRTFLENLTGYTLFDEVIYFLSTLPADISSIQVLLIICISLSLSFLSTIYPAWRVSKMSPAEILKY